MPNSTLQTQSVYGRRVRFMSDQWGLQLSDGSVDRENRIIRGVSVIRHGEALGHGVWIDEAFLDQVTAAGNASAKGIKCRFTHPGLCSDGLGKYLGRFRKFRRDNGCVRADLHISSLTRKSPDFENDPGEYVIEMADRDPAAAGASIVFFRDRSAEEEFAQENTRTGFFSPDPANVTNLPHARLARLDACDIVDDPAANPDGFFSRGEETAVQAEQTLAWLTGLNNAHAPGPEVLGRAEPERIREFFDGFMARHGLSIVAVAEVDDTKENVMSDQATACVLQEGEAPKYCVCNDCGYSEDHVAGNPCAEKTCPECGKPLVGSNEKPGETPSEPDESMSAACTLQEGDAPKYCVCNDDGYSEDYVPGSPCAEKTCPTCGNPLVGSNEKPATETPEEPEAQSRAHWKALRKAFPKDLEFATECFDKGISLSNARAKFIATLSQRIDAKDADIRRLTDENAALRKQLLGGETQPIQPSGEINPDASASFGALVRAYQREKQVSYVDAVKMCRTLHPKEFKAARASGLL